MTMVLELELCFKPQTSIQCRNKETFLKCDEGLSFLNHPVIPLNLVLNENICPNKLRGGGQKSTNQCHILFEWPLRTLDKLRRILCLIILGIASGNQCYFYYPFLQIDWKAFFAFSDHPINIFEKKGFIVLFCSKSRFNGTRSQSYEINLFTKKQILS